jgi:hypothetical protein
VLLSHAEFLQGFKAAVIFQGFAAPLAKMLEVSVKRVRLADEVLVELAQQGLPGPGGCSRRCNSSCKPVASMALCSASSPRILAGAAYRLLRNRRLEGEYGL